MAQVQVVSKGMKWTQEAANKAAQNHQYIKVGDKPGFLLLSGAPGRWKKAETAGDVYVPSLRVAGNPALIRQMFIGLGVDSRVLDQHLAQAYTAANYNTTMKAAFDAETAGYKTHKGTKDVARAAVGGPVVTLDDLQYFVDEYSRSTTVARAGSPRGSPRKSPRKSPRSKSPRGKRSPRRSGSAGRLGRVKPLAERLAEATSKGKVLDVSKMDLSKGTGVKMIVHPGAGSKKVGVAGLDIVSSDAAAYAAAVRMLGAQYEPYVAQYAAASSRKAAVVAAPPLSVAGSPRSVAGSLPPLAARSPLVGGVPLPGLPTMPGVLPTTAQPVGSPLGSPFR